MRTPDIFMRSARLAGEVRDRIIERVTDPYVRHTFWELQYPAWFKKFGPNLTSPIENKIGAVLGSPHLRAILSQKRNAITLREVMDGRKVIVALQKGKNRGVGRVPVWCVARFLDRTNSPFSG